MQRLGVVVMIANRDRQHLLRFLLLDYESIEVRLDVARQKIKNQFVTFHLGRFFFGAGFGWFRRGERGERDPVAKVRFHELSDLGFQLFRRRKGWWILFHAGRQDVARESTMAETA